ncbi:MAG TPA: hypothetical protein VGG39_17150 [Polyangiaceae bacterium]
MNRARNQPGDGHRNSEIEHPKYRQIRGSGSYGHHTHHERR